MMPMNGYQENLAFTSRRSRSSYVGSWNLIIITMAFLFGPSKAFLLQNLPKFAAFPVAGRRLITYQKNTNRQFLRSSRVFSTSSSRQIPSNEELVQRRLEIARGKKEARQESVEETTKRHMHIKSIVESREKQGENAEFHVPALYAVKGMFDFSC